MNRLASQMMSNQLFRRTITAIYGFVVLWGMLSPVDGALAQTARRNEFGPMDGKCRDACGPDCPDTCDKKEYNECTEDGKSILIVTRYTCGTHKGCRDHDDCLDACIAPYEYGNFPGTDVTWADVEFWGGGACQRECHLEALAYASKINPGHGPATVKSWATGGGPFDGSDTWEYTRDKKDGPDRTQPCGDCESCFGGVCFPEDDCEPCNSCNDVHLYTLDGLRFDFQAAGEFNLLANDDRSFVLQARQEPYGSRATVNTAVAMNVDGARVGVYIHDVLRVNGNTLTLDPMQTLDLPGGGQVRRFRRSYMIVWANGARVTVRLAGKHLNLGVVLPDEMKGKVFGVLGNFDGDPKNDIFTASGAQLSKPLTYEQLYREFGDSWRVPPSESLFDYESGQDPDTYQLPDFPKEYVRTKDLPKQDRDKAEEICRAAGVKGDAQFEDCVFDVALTGDKAFAVPNERQKTLVRETLQVEHKSGAKDAVAEATPADHAGASDIVLRLPDELLAGFTVEIGVEGTIEENDFVAIVDRESPATELGKDARVRGESVQLDLPSAAGDYEVRYVTRATPRKVLASTPVTVRPLDVSIEVPDGAARAGKEFEVVARGTLNPDDFLIIVPADSPETAFDRAIRARINTGMLGLGEKRTLKLKAPEQPGRYEVRYVTHVQPRTVYATASITVN